MEAATLNRIAELVLQANDRHTLHEHVPALVLDNKVVSIEHLQEGRSRFRGSYITSVLADYAEYLNKYEGGDIFIDPKQMAAKGYLNLGDAHVPGHADWTATLKLEPTAAYAALRAIEGKPLSQRDVTDWVEDWAAQLTALRDSESISIGAAVGEIRKITIAQGKQVTSTDNNFGAKRSAMEEIEAKSEGGLPTHIIFDTVPYIGFAPRQFVLRLAVITGDRPALTLRLIGKEAHEEQLAEEFRKLLGGALGEGTSMLIGHFQP